MPEIKVKYDILSPEPTKSLEFTGTNVSKLISLIPDILKDIFRVEDSSIFEDELKWDVSGEDTEFFGTWRAKVSKDTRTTVWISVKIQGEENKDKNGHVVVRMSGTITSSFSFENILEKALGWLHIRNVYSKQLRNYIEESKQQLNKLENEIRRKFQIIEQEV